MSTVISKRARVSCVGELYLVVARYSDIIEGVEVFTKFEFARSYAESCVRRMNRNWSFTVLPLRMPAELEGSVYMKRD